MDDGWEPTPPNRPRTTQMAFSRFSAVSRTSRAAPGCTKPAAKCCHRPLLRRRRGRGRRYNLDLGCPPPDASSGMSRQAILTYPSFYSSRPASALSPDLLLLLLLLFPPQTGHPTRPRTTQPVPSQTVTINLWIVESKQGRRKDIGVCLFTRISQLARRWPD